MYNLSIIGNLEDVKGVVPKVPGSLHRIQNLIKDYCIGDAWHFAFKDNDDNFLQAILTKMTFTY